MYIEKIKKNDRVFLLLDIIQFESTINIELIPDILIFSEKKIIIIITTYFIPVRFNEMSLNAINFHFLIHYA